MSVATVRFELVLEAKKLRRLETDVVATKPFIVVVITPAFAKIVLLLTAVVVEVTPFTVDVSVFIAEVSAF